MPVGSEVARLLARNELLDLLIEPDQRVTYAAQVLAATRNRAEAVEVLSDRLGVSERTVEGFLDATLESLTSGYVQRQLRSELTANRVRLVALNPPPPEATPSGVRLW